MLNYIYDGSFEGLLNVVFEIFDRKDEPNEIQTKDTVQINLIYESLDVKTDYTKSDRVYEGIINKISNLSLKHSYYVYLSEYEDKEILIYKYLRMGFKIGKDVDKYEFNDVVSKIHEISKQVSFEGHRMLGLLRFCNIHNDMYYAKIEPDNNIIGIISNHFANRMSDQRWIIHDKVRSIASIYDKERWIISNFEIDEKIIYSKEEKDFQYMWKKYYNTIGIKDRENPRLKKQYMPVRYWNNLIEMKLD